MNLSALPFLSALPGVDVPATPAAEAVTWAAPLAGQALRCDARHQLVDAADYLTTVDAPDEAVAETPLAPELSAALAAASEAARCDHYATRAPLDGDVWPLYQAARLLPERANAVGPTDPDGALALATDALALGPAVAAGGLIDTAVAQSVDHEALDALEAAWDRASDAARADAAEVLARRLATPLDAAGVAAWEADAFAGFFPPGTVGPDWLFAALCQPVYDDAAARAAAAPGPEAALEAVLRGFHANGESWRARCDLGSGKMWHQVADEHADSRARMAALLDR